MYVVQDGQFISQEVQRVVMAIKEYEPNLEVLWIPPDTRTEGQAAFKIVYHRPDGRDETLFHVAHEKDFDMRVLYRIIHNDQRNGSVSLSEYEAWEKAAKLVQQQKFLDELEQATDIAYHVWRSPLNTYKVSDDLVIKDNIPHNAAHLKD